jgi:hypothetical protein
VRFTTTCVLIDLTTAIALSAADFAANRYATARAHEADLLTATGTSKTSPASITSPSQLVERSAVVAKMIGPTNWPIFRLTGSRTIRIKFRYAGAHFGNHVQNYEKSLEIDG